MNSENRELIEGELEAVSGGADPLKLLATVSVLQGEVNAGEPRPRSSLD